MTAVRVTPGELHPLRTTNAINKNADEADASLKIDQNLDDVDDAETAFDNIKQAASDTYAGVVELATPAEAVTGTDDTRAVTPEGLAAALLAAIDAATGLLPIPKAMYGATITPTALGINASAIDAGADTATFTAHGQASGTPVVLTGAVATGLTTGRPYYIRAADANNLSFHTTLAGALAGTGAADLSGATTGWSLRTLIATNVVSYGMVAVGAVAGQPGTTTLGFEFNLSAAPGDCLAEWHGRDLTNTGPAVVPVWVQGIPSSVSGAVITYSDIRAVANAVSPGTWANQGTGAFAVSLVVF